MMPVSSCVCSQ